MMQLTQSVTQEIRAEMGRRQITQQDLAARTRWTPGYLSRRLTGAVPWSTDDIEEIAAALGVDAWRLVTPPVALIA